MSWIEAITLAVLQGVTEFLPVSSSGHLSVADSLFEGFKGEGLDEGQRDLGLFFAVLLHVGTLVSILVYYRMQSWKGLKAVRGQSEDGWERWTVIRSVLLAGLATLPAVVVAVTPLKDLVEAAFESRSAPGFGFLVTAVVLMISTRLPEGSKGPTETTWLDALLIGLAQSVAIFPGISRSGSTIAAALGLGFSRTWAVGFSLLMAVPAILGAEAKELLELEESQIPRSDLTVMLVATVVAALVGYGAIVWLVRVVRSGKLWYFSVYLAILGALVLTRSVWQGDFTSTSDGQTQTEATSTLMLEDRGDAINGEDASKDSLVGTTRR